VTTDPVRNVSWRGERLLPDPIDGDALRYTPILPAHVDAISVHHTTGPGLPTTSTPDQEIAYLHAIDTYHRTQRGLDAIGYQLVAFASARVYVAAPLDRYGAAVAGENNHTLGLALPGDFTTVPPAPAHLTTAARAIAFAFAYLARAVDVRPHRAWGGTACPGDTFEAWLPTLATAAADLHPKEQTMTTTPPHYHSDTEGAVMLIGLTKHPLDQAGHANAHALGSPDIGPVNLAGLQWFAHALSQSLPPAAGTTAADAADEIARRMQA